MTAPLDLEPIRAREQAATPAPWQRYVYPHGGSRIYIEEPKRELIADVGDEDDRLAVTYQRHNSDFLFHARIDIPALLAEVDRLRQRADVAEEMVAALIAREQTLLGFEAAVREALATVMAGTETAAGALNEAYRALISLDAARGGDRQ